MPLGPRDASVRRVGVILSGIEPTRMAAADVARSIEALSDKYRVTILTGTPERCRQIFEKADVLRLPSLPLRGGGLTFLLFSWFVIPWMRFDVVYAAGVINVPGVITALGSKRLCYGNSHPIQHSIVAEQKRGILSRVIARLYAAAMVVGLRRCDMVLSISPQLSSVFESYGVARSRISAHPLGSPAEFFRPASTVRRQPGGHMIAVYHGTMSPDRGLKVMIDGAAILAQKRRDFRILLVGCFEKDQKLIKELTSSASVEDLFDIRPPMQHSDLPEVLWSSDIGISLLEPNAYFTSSPPVKVLEFLAAGLPVIANDIETHRLFLTNEVNSILVRYDALSFSQALENLISNRPLRDRLSENALVSARSFSIEDERKPISDAVARMIGP